MNEGRGHDVAGGSYYLAYYLPRVPLVTDALREAEQARLVFLLQRRVNPPPETDQDLASGAPDHPLPQKNDPTPGETEVSVEHELDQEPFSATDG